MRDLTAGRARAAKRYAENRDVILAKLRAEPADSPRRIANRARVVAWQRNNRERYRMNALRHRVRKLGFADIPRPMPEACECCGRERGRIALRFDHDHQTGAFRGWLCNQCNTGIGGIGDTVEALERAIAYLKRTLK